MVHHGSSEGVPAPARQLTPLGEALEKGRLATGLNTDPFLNAHGLGLRTWDRLLYGGFVQPPRSSTVLRYARAAGVPDDVALELACLTPNRMSVRLTVLGRALERARRQTGEDLVPFLRDRKLAYSTWHDLVYGRGRQSPSHRSWPTPALVHKFADAVGLDLREADRLADEDRRSGVHSGRSQASVPVGQDPSPQPLREVADTAEPQA